MTKTEDKESSALTKVFLFEQNKIAKMLIEQEFADAHDYHLKFFRSIEDLEGVLLDESPSAVIIDIDLFSDVSLTEVELLKKNAETKEIPIIIISQVESVKERKHVYDSGAELYCSIPFKHGRLIESVTELVRKKNEEHIPLNVLIAEDSETIRAIITKILTINGHTVIGAENGEVAWNILQKRDDIDLIVSDINMPVMDGYELTRLIRGNKKFEFVPLIIASTIADKDNIAKLLNVGADDYLIKPFSTEEFLARIKAHNRVHRLYAELKVVNQRLKSFNESLEQMVSVRTEELNEANMEAIMMLAEASEYRDTDTGNHVRRIAEFVTVLTRAMGYSESKADELAYSSILHDVGKISISDAILKKPGKLTVEEFDAMKLHTINGESIISDAPFFKAAKQVARWHHEKFNGSGYPDGLKDYEIPLAARLVAVADVFDALTMERVYKKAWPIEKAHALIMDSSGKDFDPLVVEAFDKLYKDGTMEDIQQKFI